MYSGTLRNVASLSRRRFNGKRKPVILTFTSSATWTVPHGVSEVDVFLVGGGGAGGNGMTDPSYGGGGGGGGGGGNILQKPAIHVTPGENKSIVVGGSDGTTSFGTLSVNGGAKGSNAIRDYQAAVGGGGNSGGGGGSCQNRNGGSGGTQTAGGNGDANGGPRLLSAVASSFDSSDFVGVLYGNGGGGGAVNTSAGLGGVGAGNGGNSYAEATNGTSNSGGGGGGGGYSKTSGKAGGSGLVQIRYWKE